MGFVPALSRGDAQRLNGAGAQNQAQDAKNVHHSGHHYLVMNIKSVSNASLIMLSILVWLLVG
jgi:hypothetical protein